MDTFDISRYYPNLLFEDVTIRHASPSHCRVREPWKLSGFFISANQNLRTRILLSF